MGPWRLLPLLVALLLTACHVPAGPYRPPDPAASAGLVHTPAPATNQTQAASGQHTRRELYRVLLILPEGGLREGENPLRLRLLSREGQPLPGAVLRLELWLPAEALDGPRCQVEELETGLYRVNGLSMPMAGDWMLTLNINHGGREDWAVYQLPVSPPRLAPRPAPAPVVASAPPGPAPAASSKATKSAPAAAKPAPPVKTGARHAATPDLAAARNTDKGIYQVSYQSDPSRPAVKKALTWRIKVKTHKGKKSKDVSDAVVRLSARPAQGGAKKAALGPVRAKALGRGVYQVSNLTLNSPGLWLVSLDINGRQGRDRVHFNLRLD